MLSAAAELIMNSHTTRVVEAHYARITAAALSVVVAMLFGRFLCCQAIELGLMVRFGVLVRYIFDSIFQERCADLA